MQDLSLRHFPHPTDHREAIVSLLKANPTPVFLADKRIMIDRYLELKQALEKHWGSHVIAYSFKTNYLVAESRILLEQGAWAEVVSGREYDLAKRLGYSGTRIIFNGPYKTDDQLAGALQDGASLNVNDHAEIDRLPGIRSQDNKPHRIGLRLSATIEGLGHSRFGFSMESEEAQLAMQKVMASPQLELAGLHMHLLGDTDDPCCYREACRKLCAFIKELIDEPGTLQYIDLGGGFPAHAPKPRRRTDWNPRPIEEYVQAIADELRTVFPGPMKPTLILEPGRYLVCDAIIFMAQVISVRAFGDRQAITSNGSITMLPLTHYAPQVVQPFSPALDPRGDVEVPSIIYGPTCREDDVLFEGSFPRVRPGDYLVHYAVGAYNSNLSPNFIFPVPRLLFL